jgi:pSer/pThr/pTyr-binding forkhead associated (FHA) protein
MSTAKLIISLDEKVVDEVPIEKEVITIGRRTDNDLCLDNLAISGYHSQINFVLDDCFLEDLNSTNGTFVNSKIVKKHALKDGDIIDIGNHRIKYVNHLASSSANSEFEKTLILTATSDRKNATENASEEEQDIQSLENQINDLEDEICEATESSDDDNDAEESEAPKFDTEIRGEKIEKLMSIEKERRMAERRQEDIPHEERRSQERRQNIEAKNDENDLEINSQPPASNIGRIQILNGKNSGKEIALDKSLTTVGKPDVAVVGITKRNTGYFIMHIDGNSDTPSKLNGEVIAAKAEPIEDHDIIDVAGIKLEFFVE